jgi:hypothetical protein
MRGARKVRQRIVRLFLKPLLTMMLTTQNLETDWQTGTGIKAEDSRIYSEVTGSVLHMCALRGKFVPPGSIAA